MGKTERAVLGPKWMRYTVVIERPLAIEFKRVCSERGRKQNWVLAGLMRQYIGKPAREGGKRKTKKRVEPATKKS